MRKRQKLVISAIVSSIGLGVVLVAPIEWKYGLIALLFGLSWLLTAWALRDSLSGVEWLMVTPPPVLFTVSVAMFYFLLSQSWTARLATILLYGIGQYALLLTANIFSVAAIRTIQLFRAASAVGFVMTLLTGFFVYDTILSFRPDFWAVGLTVAISSFLLMVPGLWSVNLEEKLSKRVVMYSFWLSLIMGLLAAAICFWPISIAVSSLFLCTMLYIFLGVSQHYFSQRLFAKTVGEYVTVGIVVLVTMLLTSGWGV
jgi:hypothetical protein